MNRQKVDFQPGFYSNISIVPYSKKWRAWFVSFENRFCSVEITVKMNLEGAHSQLI